MIGIDVSHLDGQISWKKVKSEGFTFAFIKATEGHTFTDPMYRYNMEASKRAGIKYRSPYHYFKPTFDAEAQSHNFITQVGNFSGLLTPAVDLELDPNQRRGIDPKKYVKSAIAFCSYLKEKTGLQPIVYSYQDFWDFLGNPTQFGNEGNIQWLASYSGTLHSLAGWKTVGLQQITDQGKVAGTTGVDEDKWNISETQLKLLIIS